MQKPESVSENESYKILSDLEIQTDHVIPPSRPDLVLTCDISPSAPRYVNLFEPFHPFTAGDQLVVPIAASHIFLRYKKYNRESGRKREQTNNMFGLTQVQKESYVTLCMCRLTVFFHWSWTHSCPLVSLLRCRLVSLRHPSPTAFFELLCPTLSPAFPSYFRSPKISSPKAFVRFRAKTDKGIVCLADHLHGVTNA